MASVKFPKKLIEVALPLDDINAACSREKSIRHGHPSTLHLWWARRPLAAARAVLFSQMVNDPGGERGYYSGKTKAQADFEREALFDIIRDLVKWENTTNEDVLERARAAIRNSWKETCALNKGKPGFDPDVLPAFHDPFAGGGAIPLEAQRLGLESYASDLNPVAVMINKAMIEIPPRFAGQAPIGPVPKGEVYPDALVEWTGAKGLAEDVRRYGHWMREEAFKRIGHLYPLVKAVRETDGTYHHATQSEFANPKSQIEELTVIAWLWARTVKSPNPAFSHVEVPLVSSFILSSKTGKEAWVEPIVEGDTYRFVVRYGKPPAEAKEGTKLGRGANFKCLMSDSPIEPKFIKDAGLYQKMGQKLLAIVCEGTRGRVYLEPTDSIEAVAWQARPSWKPATDLPDDPRNFWTVNYGLTTYASLFTDRQLVALGTFSDLVSEARERIKDDALNLGMPLGDPLAQGGNSAQAYSEALSVYLGIAVDKVADRNSTLCGWASLREHARNTFGRQALPMTWDFAESNVLSDSSGNFFGGIVSISAGLCSLCPNLKGSAKQADAQTQI
jgi:putative DNA methylase